jgi:ATP-dependent Clp protease ATP-binding subunit ClpC
VVCACFTERGREVLVQAEAEARALRHNYIGSESLLLGLLHEKRGVAAQLLDSSGLTLDRGRVEVTRRVGSGEQQTDPLPFTPRASKVLKAAELESRRLHATEVDPEHILLGMARENEGMAMRILRDFDLDAEKIRAGVDRLLAE